MMKKTILLLLICVIASNCEVRVKRAKASEANTANILNQDIFTPRNLGEFSWSISRYDNYISGMHYKIFAGSTGDANYSAFPLYVVNVTKDSLEVALLQLQLQNKR